MLFIISPFLKHTGTAALLSHPSGRNLVVPSFGRTAQSLL